MRTDTNREERVYDKAKGERKSMSYGGVSATKGDTECASVGRMDKGVGTKIEGKARSVNEREDGGIERVGGKKYSRQQVSNPTSHPAYRMRHRAIFQWLRPSLNSR